MMNPQNLTTLTQPVVRTLVIGLGSMGEAIVERLNDYLMADLEHLPVEAIATLTWPSDGSFDPTHCLRQISHRAIRDQLLLKGWYLSQPDTVALFVLADWDQPDRAETVLALLDAISHAAKERYSISLIPMLVPLFTSAEGGCNLSAGGDSKKLAQLPQRFSRGVFALSRVNSDGMCLSGIDELLSKAAGLCQAWITSPLQQLPEWLESQGALLEPTFDGRGETLLIHTAGISVWEWDSQAAKRLLFCRWAKGLIDCWIKDRVAPASFTSRLFTHTSLIRSEWQKMLKPHTTPHWMPPMPWQLRPTVAPFIREDFDPLKNIPSLHGMLAQERAALSQDIKEMVLDILNSEAEGGVFKALFRLEALEKEMLSLKSSVTQRIEMFETHYDQQMGVFEATTAALKALLECWPTSHWPTWLRLSITLRQWPTLIRDYLAVNRHCQAQEQTMIKVQRHVNDLVSEQLLDRLIDELITSNLRLIEKVSEIYEMLKAVRNRFDLEQDDEYGEPLIAQQLLQVSNHHLLQQLCHRFQTDQLYDASLLLDRLGGFGQMVDGLDDQPVEQGLRKMGDERFQPIIKLSAADLLKQLYPERSDLLNWWSAHIDDGTPLWRINETQLSEGQRLAVLDNRMTAICGKGLEQIKDTLEISASSHIRWLESSDLNRITILRAGSNTVTV